MTGVGCLLTLEVHSLMPWVFLRSIGNFKSGLKDIRVFANTLVDEIDFTFAKMHFAKEVFIRDMDNIGNTMGSYIREDLEAQSEIGAVIRNLKSLGNITQQASAAANRLKEAYETFKASAKALADACPNCTHPPFSLIDSIDSGPVTTGLEQLVQRNISKLVDEAAVELHNIPNKTAEAAGSVADTLKDKIGSELNSTRVLKDIVRGARDGLINSLPSGKTVVDNVERIKGVSDIVFHAVLEVDLCINTVNILNGVWMALGWQNVFMLLAVPVAYKLNCFLHSPFKEIDFTFLKIDFVKAVFFRDLDNVGKFMGDEIHKQIEELTGIGGIMDDIKTMHSSIQQASATADRLSENLAKLKADIKKLQEACQTAGVSAPSSGAIDAIDITPLRDNVKKVAQKNVSKMVDDAAAELENIPTKTAEKAAPAVKTLKQNLDSKLKPLDVFQDVIYDARDGLVAKLPSKDTTDKFHDDVNRYGNQVIFQILFYLLVVTGLVVVFSMMGGAVLAMLSGLGGRDDVPDDIRMAFAERTSVMASVSGYMLQVALVLFFLYGWLLMTICTVLYILAPPTTKLLCEPVRDPSYTILDTLVDEHLYNGEGTFLGNMLNLSDGVLRVSDVLLGCKKNRAMYTAFLMDKSAQINFTKMLEFRDKLGVTDEINTINPKVDEFDLINDDVDAFLGDVSQLDSDTDTQVSEINSALTSTRAAVDPLAGPSSPSGVRTNAQNVQRSITTVQEDANALQQNFHDIGDPVSARVDKLKQDAQTSKDQISKKTPEAIKLAAATYKDRLLGIVDTLVNDTLDSVQNRYGKCRPLYNIWDALFVVSLCTNTMNILNGSWLALGWEHVFVLLASIPCYNLMGLVRRF
nr:hypothetical protein BaRGS_008490 [Batillaria attramentaria]